MKRVLLAEDDKDDQDIFREVINEIDPGIELKVLENGEQVLSYLNTQPDDKLPHLIILDQNMPQMKGSEAVVALRENERYQSIPSVIYSTYHGTHFVDECVELNIELFEKPDTFHELKDLISNLIRTRISAGQ